MPSKPEIVSALRIALAHDFFHVSQTQALPLSPSGRTPCRAPSMEAAIFVNSSRSFSSFGAGSEREASSDLARHFRESCWPSKRRDCSASSVVAAISSLLASALILRCHPVI